MTGAAHSLHDTHSRQMHEEAMDSQAPVHAEEKRVRKISKKEIGAPANFNHLSHVGWDRQLEGFVLAGASNPVVDVIREAIPRLRKQSSDVPPSSDQNGNHGPESTPHSSDVCEKCPSGPDSRCYVCCARQKDRVLFPCGHCFCHECTDRISDTCFTCRAEVIQIIPLYY